MSSAQKDRLLFAVVLVLAATVGCWVFVKLASMPSQAWYFLPLLAVAAVSFDAIAKLCLRSNAGKIAQLGLILSFPAVLLPSVLSEGRKRQSNVDLVAEFVKGAQPGDLILVNPWYYGVSFHYYYRGKAPWLTLPPLEDNTLHRYDLIKQAIASEKPLQSLYEEIEKTLKAGHSVWLVGGLPLPREGAAFPDLPPAPGGPDGWYAEAYLDRWRSQVGAFVSKHARDLRGAPMPAPNSIGTDEKIPILRADGWR